MRDKTAYYLIVENVPFVEIVAGI